MVAFASAIQSKENVIGDHNYQKLVMDSPVLGGRGRQARDYSKQPKGGLGYAIPFSIPVIPRHEWKDRIEALEKGGALLSMKLKRKKVPSKNQQQTNYCWTNGVVTALETMRCSENQPYIDFSPASVAAKIKNYRNEGGWGGDALEYIIKHGICPTSLWPANYYRNALYDTLASQKERSKYVITEWWELENRNFDQMMTCMLLGIPVPVGYNWWGHEVCGIDPVLMGSSAINTIYRELQAERGAQRMSRDAFDASVEILMGGFGCRFRNSWGDDYGEQGFGILTESKATADDQVAPIVNRGVSHSPINLAALAL